jgi:Xaa-Pro aminopeptidase
VTSLVNIRYLTGFTGSNAFLLAGPDGGVFVTDGRYGEIAGELLSGLTDVELVVYTSGLNDTLATAIGSAPDLDLEADHVSWSFVRTLGEHVTAELHATTGVVETLRRVKDADEIAALRRSADAGDAAFSALDALLSDATTEGELGLALIDAMRRAGGEAADWPPIVAVGANAARPHHRSGEGALADGLLLMDYGCVVDGYHSDMTRTVWVGDGGDEEMDRVHRAVAESNAAGIAAIAPGVRAHDVDEACRAVLRGYDYEDLFVHSTGHGVGLEIHEAPWVRRNSDDVLEPGHVVTVEPGVYIPGHGGVRIEDMVLVTEDGGDVLTHSSKEMRRP